MNTYKNIAESEHFLMFQSLISLHNLSLEAWQLDGTPHPIKCSDKKLKGKCSYIGNMDHGYPIVTVNTLASGGYTICAYPRDADIPYDQNNDYNRKQAQKQALKRQQAELEAKRKAELEAKRKAKNIKREIALFQTLSTTSLGINPYFHKKSLIGYLIGLNIRYGKDKKGEFAAIMLTSAENEEELGIQRLYYDEKPFSWGLKKSERFAHFVIGKVESEGIIYVCEGLADGIIIHRTTNKTVFVDLDSNGIKQNAAVYSQKYPKAQFIYVGDNDAVKDGRPRAKFQTRELGNTGVIAITEAAQMVRGKMVYPENSNDISELWLRFEDETMAFAQVFELLNRAKKPPIFKHWLLEKLGLVNIKSLEIAIKQAASAFVSLYHSLDEIESKITQAIGKNTTDSVKIVAKECRLNARKQAMAFQKKRKLAITDIQAHEQLDHKLIPDCTLTRLLNFKGVTVVKSGMGTGKTSIIGKALKDMTDSLVYIVHRVSLTRDASKKLEIGHYQDDHQVTGGLAICVNSIINKMFDHYMVNNEDAIIIVDEISQVLRHVAYGSVSNPEKVYNRLIELMKTNKCVVMDADLDQHTFDTLKSLEVPIQFIENKHNTPSNVNLFYSKDFLVESIMEAVKNGEKVAIASDSKNFVQSMVPVLKALGVNVLGVDGENSGELEQKLFLDNVNEMSKLYDVLLYSPAIGSGVSIVNCHFQKVFGLFEGTVTPSDAWQQLKRIRHIDTFDVYLNPQRRELPTDYAMVMNNILNSHKIELALILDEKGEPVGYEGELTKFDKMAIPRQCFDNGQRNDFANNFLYQCLESGGKINYPGDVSNEAKKTRTMTKQHKLERAVKCYDVGLVDIDTFKRLSQVSEHTECQSLEIEHYKIHRDFGFNEDEKITPKNVLRYDGGYGLQEIMRCEYGFVDRKDAIMASRYELAGGKAISKQFYHTIRWDFVALLFKTIKFSILENRDFSPDWFKESDLKEFAEYMWKNKELFESAGKFGCKVPKTVQHEPLKFVRTWLRKMGLTLERRVYRNGQVRKYKYQVMVGPESMGFETMFFVKRRFEKQLNHIVAMSLKQEKMDLLGVEIEQPVKSPRGKFSRLIYDMLVYENETVQGIGFDWLMIYFDISKQRLLQIIQQTKQLKLVENLVVLSSV